MGEFIIWGFVLSSLAGLCTFVGFLWGWERGTTETEQRWSEAVTRAEDRRRLRH